MLDFSMIKGLKRPYYTWPIPSSVDEEIRRMVEQVAPMKLAERERTLSAMLPRSEDVLMAFAERMSVLAVRRAARDLIEDGVRAAALVQGKRDIRESLRSVAVVFHAARLVDEDFAAIVANNADAGCAFGNDLLRGFASRKPADQTLECMGFRARGSGPTFLIEEV